MKKTIYSILFVFTIILSSCSFDASKYYTPTQANAQESKVSVEKLVAGRTAYIENCKDCHKLFQPSKNSEEKWVKYVNKMQERANITDEQKANILAYVTSEISQ